MALVNPVEGVAEEEPTLVDAVKELVRNLGEEGSWDLLDLEVQGFFALVHDDVTDLGHGKGLLLRILSRCLVEDDLRELAGLALRLVLLPILDLNLVLFTFSWMHGLSVTSLQLPSKKFEIAVFALPLSTLVADHNHKFLGRGWGWGCSCGNLLVYLKAD